ncbi:MAG: hypothetical protein U9R68_04605, partial [Planctomycetota bacterium]|nr:hypothetical protein [Planctomycetota bacterium]
MKRPASAIVLWAAALAVVLVSVGGRRLVADSPQLPKAERGRQFLPSVPEGDRWVLVWHDEFSG